MKISIVTHLVHTAVNHAARSKDIIGNNVAIAHELLCTCCASEPVQTGRVGLYNRQQVGFTPFYRLSSVIQPTICWGYIFFRTAPATELVGLCKQHCLHAVYLGLYNRQKVGVTPFYRLSRVIQPTSIGFFFFKEHARRRQWQLRHGARAIVHTAVNVLRDQRILLVTML